MPFTLSDRRFPLASLSFALAIMVTACGDPGGGNGAEVGMADLEKADGTINDAMTDLDGVRVEGTAMADIGNSAGTTSTAPAESKAENAVSPTKEEVLADQ